MLVLSRKVGQQIRIGKSVVVTLLKVDRNKARIGVEAPPGIPVFRQELLDFDRVRSIAPRVSPAVERPLFNSRLDSDAKPIRPFANPRLLWEGAQT